MNTAVALLPERVAALRSLTLGRWSPEPVGDGRRGMSVMEAAAWVAGEPVSDKPACVSPVLGEFLGRLNDDWDDEERQTLKPYVTLIVGTGGDGHDEARAYLALDWLVRVYAPAWLDLAWLIVEAAALRALPCIVDSATAEAAAAVAINAHESAWAALDAAPRLVRGRRFDPRGEVIPTSTEMWAASDAAKSHADNAPVAVAARRAARCAVYRVMRLTAQDAGDPFGPIAASLRESFLELLERMIDPVAVQL